MVNVDPGSVSVSDLAACRKPALPPGVIALLCCGPGRSTAGWDIFDEAGLACAWSP